MSSVINVIALVPLNLLNFCFDFACSRAVACCSRVAELNPYVKVYSSTEPLDGDNLGYLSKYKVCVNVVHVFLVF